MNDHLVEAFERKLLGIIERDGVDGDGRVIIKAEDLLLSIRLYKNQIKTIEKLEDRIESLQRLNHSLESGVTWHMRYEQVCMERDAALRDFSEMYKTYSQILHSGIETKLQHNLTKIQNTRLLEGLHNIANADTDDVALLQEYALAIVNTLRSE